MNYTVQPGDTLASIALDKFGDASYAEVISYQNNIPMDALLTEGKVLALPLDEVTVQSSVKVWPWISAGVAVLLFVGYLFYKYHSA